MLSDGISKENLKLDQHFLIDRKVLERIIELSEINEKDIVLEIGAGRGELTKLLAEKAGKVIAVEKDKCLFEELKKLNRNIESIYGNALAFKFPEFNKVVSNIPYSISEPLVQKLIYYDFELAVLLVPEKFSRILAGEKKTKLTLIVNTFFHIKTYDKIPPEKFFPKPRVMSRIVLLKPKKPSLQEAVLQQFLRQKDKKIKNAMREAIIKGGEKFGKKITKNEARLLAINLGTEKKVQNLNLKELEKIKTFIEDSV